MRTIEIKIFEFNELSEEAKQNAIESVRETYYCNNDFARWAIDDCALLEPKHDELVSLFGENYNFPLIENTRDKIYFDTDRDSFLDVENAMKVTNDKQFLKWLGLSDEVINGDSFHYSIETPRGRNRNTTIVFDGYDDKHDEMIEKAIDKFNNHIQDILNRIEEDIEYRFTDEAIIEDIQCNGLEFTEEGDLYQI